MKRTFLVEIADEVLLSSEDTVLSALRDWIDYDVVTCQDITATHAKEREILDRAKAWLTAIVAHDSNTNQSDDFGYAMDLERRQAELEAAVRALMEGKG